MSTASQVAVWAQTCVVESRIEEKQTQKRGHPKIEEKNANAKSINLLVTSIRKQTILPSQQIQTIIIICHPRSSAKFGLLVFSFPVHNPFMTAPNSKQTIDRSVLSTKIRFSRPFH